MLNGIFELESVKNNSEKVNLAFITNPRDFSELKTLMSIHNTDTVPDFFDCKRISITCGNTRYNSRLLVIGSTVEDLYAGLSGRNNLLPKERTEVMQKLQKGKEQVKTAVKYAINELKADVICFGAATKRLLRKSALMELCEGTNTVFTLGDNYTAAVSISQILNAASENGINLNDPASTFVIVGAYGLIGSLVAEHFSNYRCKLLLVGRDTAKFDSLLKKLNPACRYNIYSGCGQIEEKVDLIFTSTNAPGSIINAGIISKWGERIVALDVAEPANITEEVCLECADKLIRYDAGIVFNETLDFENGNQMGLRDKTLFACYSEGLIASVLADTGNLSFDRFSLMDVNSDYFEILNNAAAACGFTSNLLQSFGKPYYRKCS